MRKASLAFPLKVEGGLDISNFEILSGVDRSSTESFSQSSQCLLTFEVVNPSSQAFHLRCCVTGEAPKSHDYELGAHSVKRVMLPLERFTLNENELPPLLPPTAQYIRPAKELTEDQKRQQRILCWYKYEILQRVQFSWKTTVNLFRRSNFSRSIQKALFTNSFIT